jgi:RES domain
MQIVPLDELKKRILQLSAIDHSLNEVDVRKRYLEENAKLTIDDKIPFFIRNPESPKPVVGQKLYRVTKHFSGFQEDQLSFYKQPPKAVARQGRCNLSKYPVFYCSDLLPISLYEVIQNSPTITDEDFYITEWEVISDRRWQVLAFVFSGLPPNNPAFSYVNQIQPEVINKFANMLSATEITEYMDFYHEEFTRPNNHHFSSIVSHQFLYEDYQAHGDFVFYPSVQAEKSGNNYAFNERVIDTGELALRKVYKVHIHELIRTSPSLIDWKWELIGIGEANRSWIQWRAPVKRDMDELDIHFYS